MKKFVFGLIAGFILATMTTAFAMTQLSAYINPDIKININGESLKTEVVSVTETQKNYASVRDIAEALGATVTWNQKTKTIDIVSNKNKESEVDIVNTTTPKTTNTIEYDPEAGLPVGAEWVDFKGCKAIKYNNKIYLSESDLKTKFDLVYRNDNFVYTPTEQVIDGDFFGTGKSLLVGYTVYFATDLFGEFIGE